MPFLFGVILISPTGINAAPLSLSDSPMVVSAPVDPNIMLSFDATTSMRATVFDVENDELPLYSCTGTNVLGNGNGAYLVIPEKIEPVYTYNWAGTWHSKDGYAVFDHDDEYYLWGNSGDNKCFKNTRNYTAKLRDKDDPDAKSYVYTGRYLNWYFSNDDGSGPANFGLGARRKPGTYNRLEASKVAANKLLDPVTGLTNARVALARLDSPNGEILSNFIDVDIPANRAELITTIDDIDTRTGTVLSSTLAQIGRYFVEGNNALKLSTTASTHVDDQFPYTLFNKEPDYAAGVAKPTSTTSAIQTSCQKSFVIMMTDGEPGSDYAYSDDLAKWDDGFATKENGTSEGQDDLDDIAAALYDTDLRPDFPDNKNNVTSYFVGFTYAHDFLDRAAEAGGGEYFTANNADQLANVLIQATNQLKADTSSVASVAFNSSRLGTESSIFQAKFDTAGWGGSLVSFPLSNTGVIEPEAWNAANKLDTQAAATRNIFTYKNDATPRDGVAFTYANLSADQKADLYRGVDADDDGASFLGSGNADDDDVKLLVNYLRGDKSNEGFAATNYRSRNTLLGDIVNSSPVYVGAPELNWPDYASNNSFGSLAKSYSNFKNGSAKTRTPIVYVGANDGMLHGFNAENSSAESGEEKMAYIPGMLANSAVDEGLHYLASNSYQHRFYVDLTPSVSDVYINAGSGEDWRTVLVGGLRAGGKGLFALDVTDPTKFADPTNNADDVVLWEFSSSDDPDFGFSYSQPSIVMMPNGKWAAIVGNGYNNSGDGHAKLFILYLEAGVDGTWGTGDYIELDTMTGNTTTPNGLSTPRVVDLNGDSIADRVYAGDLQGNMWVFDISGNTDSSWKTAYGTPSVPTPLFTAKNDEGYAQPITTAPILAKSPHTLTTSTTKPNILVLFGTGKFLEPDDVSGNLNRMSFYAVLDANSGNKNRSNLEPRELITSGSLRKVEGTPIDWTTQYGWLIDLEKQSSATGPSIKEGERVISEPLLRRKVLFFNTVIPSGNECSAGGSSWLMDLAYDTGLAPPDAVFDAVDGSGPTNTIDDLDQEYVGSKLDSGLAPKSGILGEKQYTPCNSGDICERDIKVGKGQKEGSLSWEQFFRN